MPYYRRGRSTLENILLGAQAVMGIANFVGNMKTRQANRESSELDTALKVAKAHRELYPGQPVGLQGKYAEKLGEIGLAKQVTPEARTGAAEAAVQSQFPITGEGPKYSTPATAPAREAVYQRGQKSLPEGGYYLPAAKKQVGVLKRGGEIAVQNLPPGIDKILTEPSGPTGHVAFGPGGQKLYEGSASPHFVKPTRYTVQEGGEKVTYQDDGMGNVRVVGRGPAWKPSEDDKEVDILDPNYGLPVGRAKKGSKFLPAPKESPTDYATIRESETTETPSGSIQTRSRQYKQPRGQGKGQGASQAGYDIKGLGRVAEVPQKTGEYIVYKNGTKVTNKGDHWLVQPKDGQPYEVSK